MRVETIQKYHKVKALVSSGMPLLKALAKHKMSKNSYYEAEGNPPQVVVHKAKGKTTYRKRATEKPAMLFIGSVEQAVQFQSQLVSKQ